MRYGIGLLETVLPDNGHACVTPVVFQYSSLTGNTQRTGKDADAMDDEQLSSNLP